MKKTYNVYSIFEKTRVTTGLRSIAMMFVLLVCFLSYSTESSAQISLNSEPLSTTTVDALDPSIIRGFDITEDSESAITILRGELKALKDTPSVNGVAAEAEHAVSKVFLDLSISNLNGGMDVSNSLLEAYKGAATYVDSALAVNVDIDGILRSYAGLLQ